MVNLKILEACGSDNDRLRQLLTRKPPSATEEMDDCERRCRQNDCDETRKIQERISARLNEQIYFSLRNYRFYGAVDLAWEPPPISTKLWPLVLYATGKINLAQCAGQLKQLGACAEPFVKRNEKGTVVDIDLPKFVEVAVPLMRSIITRRHAAQANKYNNLFPYFKYESRATNEIGRLRADLLSQRADIMSDQYGYPHHDTQSYREAMLYGHTVDFVRASWERDLIWNAAPKVEGDASKAVDPNPTIVREGLAWVRPHPTRLFFDNAYPLASLNNDIGCSYVGFWDVVRYGEIFDDPAYWNQRSLGYNAKYSQIFSTFADYFQTYYTTINPPTSTPGFDLIAGNDRKNLVGAYGSTEKDSSVVIANYFEKIVPKDIGWGNYPYPVWVRFVVAAWDTIIYAEVLPSTPCAVLSYNEKDDRQLSLGIGHELLAWQDQMSNLLSALLLALKGDNIKVLVIDTDQLTSEQITNIRAQASGGTLYNNIQIIEVSSKKLADLGLKKEDVIQLVETRSSQQITQIFNAMLTLMNMVQQMQALSPQEQGQPAPREISATETNLIAGTTESVYNFISDAIDEFRAAKKRIIYDSLMNFGDTKFKLPVIGRYTKETIDKAGLQFAPDNDAQQTGDELFTGTLIGTREFLVHDYIFTSRDGAERASNVQTAQYLSEILKTLFPIPAFQELLTKGQFKTIVNELFRTTGAFDMNIEPSQGDEQPVAPSASEQVEKTLESITQITEQNSSAIQKLIQQVSKLSGTPNQPPNDSTNPSPTPGPA